jgi:Ca2+-binding EF-hand superfamily protein
MMCVTGRLDNKDLGTVMQNIKKVSSTAKWLLLIRELTKQQQSFKELLLILMASCLLVLCFIIYFEI